MLQSSRARHFLFLFAPLLAWRDVSDLFSAFRVQNTLFSGISHPRLGLGAVVADRDWEVSGT